MEKIQHIEDVSGLKENQVVGNFELINCQITFQGKNNLLFCEEGVRLKNSKIDFNGDNSIVFIGRSKDDIMISVSIHYDSVFGVGRDNYFNGIFNVIISEQTNVLIGDGCIISFGCWLRTGDPHLIYDSSSKKRINMSKSIYFGDHVWLGQGTMILKNTQVGSGAIIGAMSVVPGKRLISNASYGGNPCRKIKEGIFYSRECVHRWREKETARHEVFQKGDIYIFQEDENTLSFDEIDARLHKEKDRGKKLDYIKEIYGNTNKNRFAAEQRGKTGRTVARGRRLFGWWK